MKKLNAVVYNKLLLQAEEAKDQGLKKLAQGILGSLTPAPEEEKISYGSGDLNDDIYHGLWALSTNVLKYYDLESVDAEKVNEVIEIFAEKFISDLENTLGIDKGTIGPLEPTLPGENE
jgi:hypothetical protein